MVTPPDSNTPPPDSFDSETETYTEAKTRHERLKADLAALDLAEKEGKLIEAAEVERERRRVALEVEAQLMRLPDRLAPVIAAEADVFKVHAIMTAAFRETLRRLSSEG
jgi:phage terminase Nu1 subunit (DNA packaging protein)